jgi:hypothetical protein
MQDILTHAAAMVAGSLATWLAVRPKLGQLRKLTDHDAKGRFVKREKGECA